jgi:serine/threonine protein phosphatase PrpC
MFDGIEKKDQDRAHWSAPDQIACVCDGVSSSPDSAFAAQQVVTSIPAVFKKDPNMRMEALSDTLLALRKDAQNRDVVFGDVSETLRSFLESIAKQKLSKSFQTTVIAAKFIPEKSSVIADIIKCGDSAIFAFSSEGRLLYTSLDLAKETQKDIGNGDEQTGSFVPDRILFGPGDELLAKVLCRLSDDTELSKKLGFKNEYSQNWLVCTPLDGPCVEKVAENNKLYKHALVLMPEDRLLVPEFAVKTASTVNGQSYCSISYSNLIRPVTSEHSLFADVDINKENSTTLVLPDHFYCGHCDFIQERFPLDTHFVLASDGFYSAFTNSNQMWQWLQENKRNLRNEPTREEYLQELHTKLKKSVGDDDISFVWAYPSKHKGGSKNVHRANK